ncbi:signal peptide peptidase SppA [Sediminitomix flava]|uniref:Protease-4 n=1 Tax=Sediminitomix flava TaxID=379075 RepID=A0A315Z8N9_SEDFL|nr:signal peptide peptidase SppA [Sediminitomix flava]PWJ40060.1 protease-4 [Sediminitomix flava]
MGQFIREIFASIVGVLIAVFILAVMGVAVMVSSAVSSQEVSIDDNSILEFNLNQPLKEIVEDDFSAFLELAGLPSEGSPLSFQFVLKAIKEAKTDDNVKAIYLKGGNFKGGYAQAEELRDVLVDFKLSGKPIFAYADNYSEKTYYITSVANEVIIPSVGSLEFNGLSQQLMYFTGMFEKLGVKAEVFKVGTFKSAVEPFINKKMSPANRQQTEVYLNSLYDHYLQNVALSRGLDKNVLKEISNKMLVQTPEDALKYKLVTEVAYEDVFKKKLYEAVGLESSDANMLKMGKYISSVESKSGMSSSNQIAVLVAEGEIIYGEGSDGTVGNVEIVERLRELGKDDDVKAVVFRVNSPGGSALASDLVWREIQLLRKKKPVVASMSDVAASGGYYFSMGTDKIVASPNTITGSIGVFGVLFNPKAFMNNKLGVTFDAVSTGEYSNFMSTVDDFNENDKRIVQNSVNRIYSDFTSKAASGRNMELDALRAIAEGRVWTGQDALERGLVDELGGTFKAVEVAAELANLEEGDYEVTYQSGAKSIFEKFAQSMEQGQEAKLKEKLGPLYNWNEQLNKLQRLEGVQARMPYELEIY